MLTRRDGLLYLGGNRLGMWLFRGDCEQHHTRCSGITRSSRAPEVSIRGRSAGLCW